jgi:predicted DNA-binding transcriptional regulator YafY
MPKPNCVIKFPQKGRSGRKGYKEDDFKTYLTKYFKSSFQLFDDRFILVKGSNSPYEPDFTLIDEKGGVNIFLDVEIDEPYEGINNIEKRKATHFQFADANRNNAFKNRGWIVIRFAEIQVHQNPNSCCLFVADVIANIHSQFKIPTELISAKRIISIPQWTKEEAEKMSREKYRERYLGIDSFGFVANNSQITASETELGKETEDIVKDEAPIIIPATIQASANPNHDLIRTAINNKHFVSFIYNGTPTIVKLTAFSNGTLNAYCYIKNTNRVFTVANIINPVIKQRPFTLEVTGPNLGLDRIVSVVNTAIQYHKFIRMRYTRSAWTSMQIDKDTGEIIADVTEAEESTRTINNVQLSINALDQEHLAQYNLNENYITAYCNRREEQRTFKFDRISELAILNL